MTGMIEEAFFDSNIFIYAYSLDPADAVKSEIAAEILLRHQPVLSSQVLQEFLATALRKKNLGIDEGKFDLFLEFAKSLKIVTVTLDHVLHAVSLRRRYSFSHWDSTVIAAAHSAGCQTLYSEDLQHGFCLDHLTVVNPFVSGLG